jgi:hypothetical protein
LSTSRVDLRLNFFQDPLTDKPAVYAHCFGRFDPRLARSYHLHRDTAQLCLVAGVNLRKSRSIAMPVINSEIRRVLPI